MDPLDKILSVIVMNAIVIVSQDTEQPSEESRRYLSFTILFFLTADEPF